MVIDFQAARARIESLVVHEIEISAAAIPSPARKTFLDLIRADLGDRTPELLSVVLEESK